MAKPKILVVAAEAAPREFYREALKTVAADLIECETGRDAIAAAQKREFALILIDIEMSGADGIDGFEIAAMLRQDARTAVAPIVFLSLKDEAQESRKMAYRMGAAGVLQNVADDPEVLRLKTRAFLEMYQRRNDVQLRIAGMQGELERAREDLAVREREVISLRRQSTSDLLTGLPNRLLFEDRITGALTRARRSHQRLGLAYLDLDGFKAVNDRYGKAAGDEILATVSRRLVTAVRASDTVARLGADVFALVLEGLDSLAGAEYVGNKVLTALKAPFTVKNETTGTEEQVVMGASIGMALCPEHAETRNDLLMMADMAMYAVKRDGGGLRIAARPPETANPGVVQSVDFRTRSQS